jgi:osmotically inducible protein OsmC
MPRFTNNKKEDIIMAVIKTNWNGDIKGFGKVETEHLDAKIAVANKSGGTGEGATPKELLASSVASCYIITLMYAIEARTISVVDVQMDTEIKELENKAFEFIHYPKITLPENADKKDFEEVNRLFEIADRGCTIGKLLKKADVSIRIQGEVNS